MKKTRSSAKKEATAPQTVVVRPPNFVSMRVTIVGTSSLIVNNKFTYQNTVNEAAPGDQTKPGPKKKPVPTDQEMFDRSRYLNKDGRDSFPANGIKQAMVHACGYVAGMTKVSAKGLFFVFGDDMGDLAVIKGQPTMERIMVRRPVGHPGAGSVPIVRAEYVEWSMDLVIRFDADFITAQDIVNLLNLAGVHSGIGEWRPSSPVKSGVHGMFEVSTDKMKKGK